MERINTQSLKTGDRFVWSFCNFEGKQDYLCTCLSASDSEILADVPELGATVTLEKGAFCEIKSLYDLTIQEWQRLFEMNEICRDVACDSIIETARQQGVTLITENVTTKMVEDYVCGYFCELASLFEENAETDGKEIYITIPF